MMAHSDPAQGFFTSVNIRVRTPDGTMYVMVMEDAEGNPVQVQTHIGKSGNSAAAWAQALDGMITMALTSGVGLDKVMNELRDITTDRSPRMAADGSPARSGPEGIWKALMMYRKGRFDEIRKSLGESPRFSHGPTVGT